MSKPSVDPRVWSPPPPGPDSPAPLPALRVHTMPGEGPEDVLVDDLGRVVTGLADGRIVRFDERTGDLVVMARTGGRPLGLEWLPDGRLLVCDALRGLLAVDLADGGEPEVLAERVDGRPLRFCNNAGVAADGTVWFSDSSARFGVHEWKADIIEHSGTGRLMRRDPDGSTTAVVTGLQFANGVAVSPDGEWVYYAETGAYALSRVATSGAGAGRPEQVGPALPGFPDNISTGSDGLIWVAIASPRNAILDRLGPRHPALRKVVWALPDAVQPKPESLTRALAVDPATGSVVRDLAGEHERFGMSTGVREHYGTLWLGSLTGSTIASATLA